MAARDYDGVALELRTDPPADFALYSEVDIEGPDPNDLGLLGNDNSPGKDVDNQRLFDRIGGSAAGSQTDGFPGFGGVFVESFLVYSAHPPARVQPIGVTSRFDDIFDSVRPDSGMPVSALEARAGIAELTDGAACLDRGRDRATRVACAVHVLGNLIGSTLSHELGHSLGLADPYGTLAHDPGDADNRI